MANWKYKLDLSEPRAAYGRKELTLAELCKKFAAAISEHPLSKKDETFQEFAVEFESLSQYELLEEDDFDDLLSDLYDYADEDHRLWINLMPQEKFLDVIEGKSS